LSLVLAGCATSTRPVRAFAVRLHPGADLRVELEKAVAARGIQAGFVATCAGSLRVAAIRFADQPEASVLQGPFEIVSLTGTFSPDGPHLHISVAGGEGRVVGGHLATGSIVYTTAEVVIGEVVGGRFGREVDPVTTFKELVIDAAVQTSDKVGTCDGCR